MEEYIIKMYKNVHPLVIMNAIKKAEYNKQVLQLLELKGIDIRDKNILNYVLDSLNIKDRRYCDSYENTLQYLKEKIYVLKKTYIVTFK